MHALFGNTTPLCIYDGCSQPSFIDTSGRVHDYCGRTHARLHLILLRQECESLRLQVDARSVLVDMRERNVQLRERACDEVQLKFSASLEAKRLESHGLHLPRCFFSVNLWHISHRIWNKLLHSLYGNQLDSVAPDLFPNDICVCSDDEIRFESNDEIFSIIFNFTPSAPKCADSGRFLPPAFLSTADLRLDHGTSSQPFLAHLRSSDVSSLNIPVGGAPRPSFLIFGFFAVAVTFFFAFIFSRVQPSVDINKVFWPPWSVRANAITLDSGGLHNVFVDSGAFPDGVFSDCRMFSSGSTPSP